MPVPSFVLALDAGIATIEAKESEVALKVIGYLLLRTGAIPKASDHLPYVSLVIMLSMRFAPISSMLMPHCVLLVMHWCRKRARRWSAAPGIRPPRSAGTESGLPIPLMLKMAGRSDLRETVCGHCHTNV